MDAEIKVFGFPSAFGLASFDPSTLALKIFLQVNGFKWTDVNVNDYTSMQSRILPVLEVNGKQISGLQDSLAYLSDSLLGRPLSFVEKETINLIEIKLNSKLMEDMFAEPLYNERIKSLLFQATPFYRVFYDSWMAASFFKSKIGYSKKFLQERTVEDVLRAFSESDIIQKPEALSAPACALLGYLFVASRVYGLKGDDTTLNLIPKALLDFAMKAAEELLTIPYRGSNRLMSTVDEATTSPTSSVQSNLFSEGEDQRGVMYLPSYVPAIITAGIVAALALRLMLLPKAD